MRRNEQNALLELFKVKATAKHEGEGSGASGGGADKRLLGLRKLEVVERLMRTRGADTSNK